MCSTMVSRVEPLAQRIQPSSSPIRKICASVKASYCTCIAAHAADVAISVPDDAEPRGAQAAEQEAAERDLLGDRRDDHDGDEEKHQRAGLARADL